MEPGPPPSVLRGLLEAVLDPWWQYHISAPTDRRITGNIGEKPWAPRRGALLWAVGLVAAFAALHGMARAVGGPSALFAQWMAMTVIAIVYINFVVTGAGGGGVVGWHGGRVREVEGLPFCVAFPLPPPPPMSCSCHTGLLRACCRGPAGFPGIACDSSHP
jgi:hypothetical protein